jgi:uncharacterized iron-regulated membrane protein
MTTAQKTLRKWAYLSHLWIGIGLSIYFTMLGLTGSSLMFKTDLHRIFEPHLYAVPVPPDKHRASLDSIAKTFGVITHGAHLSSMILPMTETDPIIIGYKPLELDGKRRDWRQCYFNPYSGAVLGDEVTGGKVFRTLRNLHAHLLLEDVGSKINGFGVLFLIVLLLSGLWLWCPSLKYFREQFLQRTTIRLGSSFGRVNYDIHNAVGFYSSLMLLMFALTATTHLWRNQTVAVLSTLTGTPAEQIRFKQSAPPTEFSYDEIIDRVKGAVPGYSPAIITDTMHVLMAQPDNHLFVPTMVNVAVNKDSGLIENVERSELQPVGKQIMNWLMPIHFGQFGSGWLYYPIKAIWFIAGFCPITLATTGILMYLNKQKRLKVKLETHNAEQHGTVFSAIR